MIDLNKSIEEISVDSTEEYLKAIDIIESGKVFDVNSNEGIKIQKLVLEINRYNNSQEHIKLNPTNWLNKDERLNVKPKKYSVI